MQSNMILILITVLIFKTFVQSLINMCDRKAIKDLIDDKGNLK